MKTCTSCSKPFHLALISAALLCLQALPGVAAPQAELPTQLPKKTVVIKNEAKPVAAPTSNEKKVNSSGGLTGPIRGIIDDAGGGAVANMDTVSITTVGSISPLGIAFTVTPDTTLPLSAWVKVECSATTKYFDTITGSTPNDDNITTSPSLSLNGNALTFSCPYKSSAHALNIAKSVAMPTKVSISHTKNGMNYTYNGTLLYSCTRTTKTTVNWTCN